VLEATETVSAASVAALISLNVHSEQCSTVIIDVDLCNLRDVTMSRFNESDRQLSTKLCRRSSLASLVTILCCLDVALAGK